MCEEPGSLPAAFYLLPWERVCGDREEKEPPLLRPCVGFLMCLQASIKRECWKRRTRCTNTKDSKHSKKTKLKCSVTNMNQVKAIDQNRRKEETKSRNEYSGLASVPPGIAASRNKCTLSSYCEWEHSDSLLLSLNIRGTLGALIELPQPSLLYL